MYRRPVLVCGMLLFLIISCLLPGRILAMEVSGNDTISEKQILAEMEKAGVTFGAEAKKLRSEEMKNRLLTAIPELQWVGINTSGCVAKIEVQERSQKEPVEDNLRGISHIVAAHDGIVTEMTIEKGNALVKPGQSVQRGDILVSGYADYGLKVSAQNADGEIMAHTIHENMYVAIKPAVHRGAVREKHTCVGVRIGKKVINFCNHSGIRDAVCVKMYSEDYWVLPGGFRLPVSFIRTECTYYEQQIPEQNWNYTQQWLPGCAQQYLRSQMVSGKILQKKLSWRYSEDTCYLMGIYACHEMIGKVKYEEIMEYNAEDN